MYIQPCIKNFVSTSSSCLSFNSQMGIWHAGMGGFLTTSSMFVSQKGFHPLGPLDKATTTQIDLRFQEFFKNSLIIHKEIKQSHQNSNFLTLAHVHIPLKPVIQ